MEKRVQMVDGSLMYSTTLLSVNLDSQEVEARIDLWACVALNGVRTERCFLLSFKFFGSAHLGWQALDESYSSVLPYLKPIESFRRFLLHEMKRESDKLDAQISSRRDGGSLKSTVTRAGFGCYSLELEGFSETRALLGQLKRSVEAMMQQRKRGFSRELAVDPNLLKQALKVLGETPCTDRQFSVLQQ